MPIKLMWTGRVISVLIALLLTMSAVMKLMGGAEVTEGFAHMGLPASLRVPLGILEFSCVVIYLIPATSVTGAILLTGYVGGAIVTHLRIGESVYIQIALGILIWLGLYLREHRLKALIPLRTQDAGDFCFSRSTNGSSAGRPSGHEINYKEIDHAIHDHRESHEGFGSGRDAKHAVADRDG